MNCKIQRISKTNRLTTSLYYFSVFFATLAFSYPVKAQCSFDSNDAGTITDANFSGTSSPVAISGLGQSFEACGSGSLNSISVFSLNTVSGVTITVYEGAGNGGTLLGTITGVSVTAATASINERSLIDVSSAGISVTSGNTYTFYFSGTSFTTRISNSSIYAGGIAYSGATGFAVNDFLFSIDITSGAVTPEVTLSTSPAAIAENGGTATLTATASVAPGADETITLNYTGSATNGSDYSGSTTITILSGATTGTTTITGIDDNADDDAETIIATITGTSTATIGSPNSATITINDDDPVPELTIADVTLAEGLAGTTNFNFTVSLNRVSTQTVTVNYSTADGTAIAGVDYTAVTNQAITILPGNLSGTATVAVNGETLDELDETFTVTLSSPANATLGTPSSATGTITNDDTAFQPELVFSRQAPAVNEGNDVYLIYELDAASGRTTSFTIQATGGSATLNTDYTFIQTATIIQGDTKDSIRIAAANDTFIEGPENFTIDLLSITGLVDNTSPQTFTLNDTDAATVAIADVTASEGDAGTQSFTFTVTANTGGNTIPNGFSIDYATSDGTATTADGDYVAASGTLTFTGTNGETQTFPVTVNGDTNGESDEAFNVTLSNLVVVNSEDITISDAIGVGNITNDDDITPPTVAISTTAGDPTNANPIPVTVTFSEPVTGFVAGDLVLSNGVASNFSGTGAVYTFDLTPSSAGVLTVDIGGGIAVDGAGNGNTAAAQFSITFDGTSPAVNITSTASSPTSVSPVPITITFDEPVTGFMAGDLVLGGGTSSNFSGTGTTYTFDFTPTGDGTLTVDIGSNAALDAAGNGNTAATQFSIQFDGTGPTVNITSTASNPTSVSPIPITITFDEPVTGFVVGDLSVSGGTVSNFSGTGATYTFDLTPTGDGTLTVDVGGNAALDAAGNGNTAATQFSIDFDTTGPTVGISSSETSPTNASPIPITVTFNEAVTGFVVGDLSVSGATVSNFSGTGATYTFDLTPTAEGMLTVDIGGNAALDAAGNGNTAATQFSIDFDTTSPTVGISSSETSPTNISPIPVTITFDEAVTGFVAGDLVLGGGTSSNFSGTGTTYTFDFTPTGDGTLTVDIGNNAALDAAGNGNTAATQFSIQFDGTGPTVNITSTASSPTSVSPIPITITFDEPVTGFVVGDLIPGGGTVSNFSGTGATYTFDLTPTGDGTLTVDVGSNAALDAAGNGNTAATQFSIDFDTTGPTVGISSTETSPTNASPIPITVTFNEAVMGFVVGDLSVAGGTVSNFSGTGATYTFDLTPTGDGPLTVDIGGNVALDVAGNGNTAATQFSITFDGTNPTLNITSTASSPTSVSPVPITITFDEPVTGFVAGDLVLGGGTSSNFSGTGTTYTFDFTPTGDGTLTVDVGGNAALDAAGNGNTAATQFSIDFDTTGPTVGISSTETSPTNASPIPVTVTFNEAVTGFVVGDLSVAGGTVSNFSGMDATYTFDLTPTGDGTLTVDVGGNVALDAAGNGNSAATQFSIDFDTASPTVGISSSEMNPTNAGLIPVTVMFNEAVTGFVAGDLSVSGGTVNNFSGTGATYTFDLTPTGDGPLTVDIGGNVALDVAGNGNTAATQFSITFDGTNPTLNITSTASNPTNVSPIPITITFDELVTGFVAGDLILGGGTSSNFLGAGTTYTFDFTPTGDGPLTVDIGSNVAFDLAGNGNSAATQFSIDFDTTSPTVGISSSETSPTNASQIPVTVMFNEAVTGFVAGDLILGGGTSSNFSGTGTTYTFDFTPTGDGTLTVDIGGNSALDAAGNGNTAASQFSIVSDRTAPSGYSVSMDLLGETQINATNQGNIEFTGDGLETGATLNYSFTSSGGGIAVTGSEAVTLASQVFDNGGAGYDLSGLADGTITLTISLTDAAGNIGVGATTTETKDAAPPTGYTVVWDDALISSSEATATTFTVINTEIGATIHYTVSSTGDGNTATVSNTMPVTTEPQEVTVDVSSLPDGALTVQVTLTDPGNNTGSPASDNSAILDQQLPSGYTVTIDQADINTINQTAASFTFAGAEIGASYNFTLTSTGGAGTVTGTGNVTMGNQQVTGIDVSPLPDGTLTLSVTLSDLAGNMGAAATDNVVKITTTVQFTTTNGSGGEATASAPLGVSLSSSSAQVISVSYTVSGTAIAGGTDHDLADGILTITPGNTSGTIEISNIVDDNILETNETVIVTLSSPVNAVLGANTLFTYTILDNDAAAVTIADVSGDENDGAITVTATLDNAVQGGFTLEVSTSDGTAGGADYTPVTSQVLTFAGSAMESQTFTVTPVADSEVESDETVTLTMSNLGATTLSVDISNTATLTINNDDNAPVIDPGQVLTVVEGTLNTTLVGTISAQDVDGDALQDWTITAGNTSLDGDAVLPFNLDPSSGMLTVNDSDDLASSLTVFLLEITVSDGVNVSSVETVTVNVEGVNDAPVFTPGSSQQVLEDAGLQTVGDWATGIDAGAADESGQGLTFNVTVNETTLFSQQPAINAEGTLTYSPAPDANGVATVTIFLQDDGGTANGGVDRSPSQSFDINIMPVNDAPSFTGGADQNVTAAATVTDYTENNWATNIRSGPLDEAGQALMFDLQSSNTGLFNALPAIDASGTLSYAIAPNVVGSSTISVTLLDDGGTANGGQDVSPVVTFTINVGRLPQVITFEPLEDRRVGANPIMLEATGGNSGQPVVFSLVTTPMTGVASLNGNLLTIDGPGTATVTASQLGNAQYEPAQDVSRTFEVIASELFLPSLFSPNDDQVNDRFVLRGGGNIAAITLSIFDRDGNEVYTSQSLAELTQQGWDGTYEGESQPQGAYIWVIQGSLTDGAPLTVRGEKSGIIRLAR